MTAPPRRILVPVDFAPASGAAVEYAANLAELLGAEIQILHVWQPTAMPATWPYRPDLEDFEPTYAGAQMKRHLALVERRGIRVLGRLEGGEPVDTILEVAGDGFDLVVLGTVGRTGISRLLHRGVAEKVIRQAPCPVVVVRTDDGQVLESEPVEIAAAHGSQGTARL